MDQPIEDMDQPLEDEFNHTNEEVPRGKSYRTPTTLENTEKNFSEYDIDVDLSSRALQKKVRGKQIEEWKNPTEKHELSSCIRKRLIPPCWMTHINTPQKWNECIEDGKNSTNCRYSEHLEEYVPHCVKADTSKCRKATKEYDDWKEKYNSKKEKKMILREKWKNSSTTAADRGAQVKFAKKERHLAGQSFLEKYGTKFHQLDRNKIPPIRALHSNFELADMDDKLGMLYHLNNDIMFGENRWRKARDENGKRVYVAAQTDWETDEGWATYWYGPTVNNFIRAKNKEWCPKESYDENDKMCKPEEEEIAEQFEKNVNILHDEASSQSLPPLGGGRRRRKTRVVKRNKKKRTRRRNKNIKRLTKKRRSKKRKGTRKI